MFGVDSDASQDIDLTRDEYEVLKLHTAKMRRYELPVPAPKEAFPETVAAVQEAGAKLQSKKRSSKTRTRRKAA